jgi:hypothetical protein
LNKLAHKRLHTSTSRKKHFKHWLAIPLKTWNYAQFNVFNLMHRISNITANRAKAIRPYETPYNYDNRTMRCGVQIL